MRLDAELIETLNLLMRYRLNASPAGLEIGQTADPATIAAAQRLFERGLIERADGGPLTESGRQAVDHITRLFNQLSPPLEPI